MKGVVEQTQHIVLFLGVIVLCWVLLQVKSIVFKKMRERKDDLKTRFMGHISSAIIVVFGVILAFSTFGDVTFMWKSMLGGTAFVSALVVFMAQDVIKDILAGLMISIFQPFEIGDRIQIEEGVAGIVEDVTMRHTVLVRMDTLRIVVPNRRLQDMILNNYSYNIDCRSAMFTFEIAYASDVDFAKSVIRQAIMESPYSVPGRKTKNGMDYGDVYFMRFDASSLILQTLVYYMPGSPTEAMISDVNVRVDKALWENHIEIPYPHVTVMKNDNIEKKESRVEDKPLVIWKTPLVRVFLDDNGIERAMEETSRLGELNGLSKKEVMRLRLLGEEMIRLVSGFVGDNALTYWVEHKQKEYRVHVGADVIMTNQRKKKLIALSTSGKNDAYQSFSDSIRGMIISMVVKDNDVRNKNTLPSGKEVLTEDIEQASIFSWSLKKHRMQMEINKQNKKKAKAEGENKEGENKEENVIAWEELEHSIIAKIADDIRISISNTNVEVIAFKVFE